MSITGVSSSNGNYVNYDTSKVAKQNNEKAKYLEINLDAIPESVYNSKVSGHGIKTYISFKIEPDGSISATCGGTNDPDGKIARENAQKNRRKKR